jgi:serine/threonine protein kinase
MEYFPLGDLDSFIQSAISEGGAREIASQLLQGLCFMHGEGYAHRDLKPGVSPASITTFRLQFFFFTLLFSISIS